MRRDALINLIGNLTLAVLAIGSGKAISSWFGPSGRGVLGAAQVAIALAGTVGGLGLGDAVLYRRATGNHPTLLQLVRWAGVSALTAGAIGLLAGALLGRWQSGDASATAVTLLVGGGAAATAFMTVTQGHARGAGDFLGWNVVRIAATVAWIAALLVGRGAGASLRLGPLALCYVGLVLVCALVPLRSVLARHAPDATSVRKLLHFGVPAALGAFPQTLNARVDQFSLAAVSPARTVGFYAAAAGYCWAVVPLSQALANLLFTRVANRTDPTERIAVLVGTVRLGVTGVVVSAGVAWLAAGWAVPLLNTSAFGPAVGLARILLIGAALQSVTFLLEEGTRGLGRPRIAMVAELTGLAVMGVLLVLVVRRGATAVAWASVAGYAASFVTVVVAVSRVTGVKWHRLVRPGLQRPGAVAVPTV